MTEKEQRIRQIAQEMTIFRRTLHAWPEPAFEEHRTASLIVERLAAVSGVEISEGVGGTGVVAVIGREKKGLSLALRADMDCLRLQEKNTFPYASVRPGLMHGCGHDGHTACLLGAAILLGEMQDELAGPVKCIFQPAEENLGGAQNVIADGALADPVPRAIFALHGAPGVPLGSIATRKGPIMAASRYFDITVRGRGTHAAMPHLGDDVVLTACRIVCEAQSIISRNISPLESALISIPRFLADTSPNVIPENVALEGTLRALSNETRSFLERRLAGVVENTAKAAGVAAEIIYKRGYPLVENDPVCFDYLVRCAEEICGKEGVQAEYPPAMSAEDFAFYLEKVPGAFFWLGLRGDDVAEAAPLHSPFFDFNDAALETGIALFCRLALQAGMLV